MNREVIKEEKEKEQGEDGIEQRKKEMQEGIQKVGRTKKLEMKLKKRKNLCKEIIQQKKGDKESLRNQSMKLPNKEELQNSKQRMLLTKMLSYQRNLFLIEERLDPV